MNGGAGAQASASRMRLDQWLWRARFFKTRTQAAEAIASAGARIERDGLVRRIDKGATTVEIGDLVNFTRSGGVVVVEVCALPARRGPAKEAQTAYRTLGDA